MEANNAAAMRDALTALVDYLNKEVKRTSKCRRCRFRGKTFRSEPCYWHVDCGIDDCDQEASGNAMYLLKRFRLQEALVRQPRNCDVGTAAEQTARIRKLCTKFKPSCIGCPCYGDIHRVNCWLTWAQMPYAEGEATHGNA